MKTEICIVGAGPAGLAAAIALTNAGREVVVLDQATPPIDKACGEGLLPDSLAALANLGVTLPDSAAALRGICFLDPHSCASADFSHGFGRGVRRLLLHQTLLQRAGQINIRMLWGVKNVSTRSGRVTFNGGHIDTSLIVGADGQNSSIRSEAGLSVARTERRRFGFRKHYALPPWSQYVEVYWGNHFQIYVTPVASDQVCVAVLSSDPRFRLDAAINLMPALAARLRGAPETTLEKGSLSVSRKLHRVSAPGYVLLGDASGSVDAITGEGMCLAFKQSAALVDALAAGDMRLYESSHRSIASRPRQMEAVLGLLGNHEILRRKSIAGLAAHPRIFNALLAAHVGSPPWHDLLSWQAVSFGFGVLRA